MVELQQVFGKKQQKQKKLHIISHISVNAMFCEGTCICRHIVPSLVRRVGWGSLGLFGAWPRSSNHGFQSTRMRLGLVTSEFLSKKFPHQSKPE